MKSLKHAGCGSITVPSKFSIVTHTQQKDLCTFKGVFYSSRAGFEEKGKKALDTNVFPFRLFEVQSQLAQYGPEIEFKSSRRHR
jgi:hypothetical protein